MAATAAKTTNGRCGEGAEGAKGETGRGRGWTWVRCRAHGWQAGNFACCAMAVFHDMAAVNELFFGTQVGERKWQPQASQTKTAQKIACHQFILGFYLL
jgi:hypothetical protein